MVAGEVSWSSWVGQLKAGIKAVTALPSQGRCQWRRSRPGGGGGEEVLLPRDHVPFAPWDLFNETSLSSYSV